MKNIKLGWKFWLGLLISIGFLVWALHGLELKAVLQEMGHANYWYLIPGVAVYFVAVWARTWRWQYLLRPMKWLPLKRLFPIVVIGYMGNNVYPIRAGEFIRAYVLKRATDVPISASLATIVVERVFDGLVMLLFVFVAIPFVVLPQWLDMIIILSTILFAALLAVLAAITLKPQFFLSIYTKLAERFLPKHWHAKLSGIIERFITGLASLGRPKDLGMVLLTSVVIWLTETTKYWILMHGFPFKVSFLVLMLMTAVVNLATTIPSAPGYAGTFDGPGIKILAAFGVAQTVAASYTLVLHGALWFPITMLGFFYMWKESVSWREFGVARMDGRSTAATAETPKL